MVNFHQCEYFWLKLTGGGGIGGASLPSPAMMMLMIMVIMVTHLLVMTSPWELVRVAHQGVEDLV